MYEAHVHHAWDAEEIALRRLVAQRRTPVMRSDEHLPQQLTHRRVARRHLLQSGGMVAGGAVAAGIAFPARALAAGVPAEQLPAWLDHLSRSISALLDDYQPVALSERELATLRAVVGRLIPTDDLGPGADEAGVHVFIDRALAAHYAPDLPRYQAMLAALDTAVAGDGFAAATPERQDELLTRFEAGDLAGAPQGGFALVLEHIREGMFGDPVYGGNQNFAGWDLIGYPGIKLVWSEADQQIDADVKPLHISVAQYGGTSW
jgi:gluconate 2-dehydrogenase gamma chain